MKREIYARIEGVGMYLPQERITNAELGRLMDYDVEGYLREKGIGVRHRAAAGPRDDPE